jgi:hypothetical protein
VAIDMPLQRKEASLNRERELNIYLKEIYDLRTYDRTMRDRQWAHDTDIHNKIIQSQDVANKTAMETMYEIKRLREINEKILNKQ